MTMANSMPSSVNHQGKVGGTVSANSSAVTTAL